jgi:putative DNA primase/helicase
VNVGSEWFSDHLSDLGNKDSRMEMLGRWIIELSELDRVRRGDLARIKAFLTCRVDVFRPPYGRRVEAIPRQCVFCATVNDSEILTDPSGGRRFWPVETTKVDIDSLRNCRDQLWAEAYARYQQGEAWWLESEELTALAEAEQAKHYEPGPRDELIEAWIKAPQQREKAHGWDEDLPWQGSRPGKINISDVLVHCFGIPIKDISPSDSHEVGRCLRHLGWKIGEQETAGLYRGKRYCISPEPPGMPLEAR